MVENLRKCPFCRFNEAWMQQSDSTYAVVCNVCLAEGPKSNSDNKATKLWNGILKKLEINKINQYLKEEAMGGASAPISTLNNTPGIGNATPSDIVATTGAQFTSNMVKGSGDRWDNNISKKKKKKGKAKHKITPLEEFISIQNN